MSQNLTIRKCVKTVAAVTISLIVTPSSVFAGDDSAFTISPMVGKMFFAKNQGVEDENTLSLGLGYEFDRTWATEFTYLEAEPEIRGTSNEVDLTQLRLDALYHLSDEQFRPYLVAGLGENDVDSAFGGNNETIANIGVGFKYALNNIFELRGDARLIQGLEEGESDYLAALGAVLRFGGSSPSKKPAKKVVAKVDGDSDRDGVKDSVDRCPSSAAGVQVDAQGCELILDADNDGIVDAADQCPNSAAGSKVNSVGCYDTLKEDVTVSLNVNFATNSANVVSDAVEEVRRVAKFMAQYPSASVVFEGHTDDLGAAAYNKSLSQRRAEAVANILVEQFDVSSERVSAIGYGEEKPLVENNSRDNRAKNRRVSAVVKATVESIVK